VHRSGASISSPRRCSGPVDSQKVGGYDVDRELGAVPRVPDYFRIGHPPSRSCRVDACLSASRPARHIRRGIEQRVARTQSRRGSSCLRGFVSALPFGGASSGTRREILTGS
jgi:hypothetical protein